MTRFLNYTAVDPTINWERIDVIRQRLTKRQASLCSQRAVFYTQSFQESEVEPYIVRKAKAFAYTLEHMDLYIEPDSLFFGNQASKSFAAPIFPEYSIDGSLTSSMEETEPLHSNKGLATDLNAMKRQKKRSTPSNLIGKERPIKIKFKPI